ncbi:hypothetical protein F5B22DRAFT_611570 [Xylaria bambusicola]|uniref:uncharacterized protein n=1 Tax=Xylaria bambusicola TaxID=326684 RepID=UPI002007244F|nr:uncharacterized protein F5B22DRAFT_611570 [Xylaria bambusicola]KAI0514431.1 hypothetical protein F5B22DRAFT_611570 [Xylaria bambusicola]
MVGLRLTHSMRALRATTRTGALHTQQRTFIAASPLRAHQGYGDGKGDPVAEHPEKQPAHTKAQESSEHPGPAPPDVGQGSSSASTKRSFSDSMKKAASNAGSPEEQASAQSGGSRSKEAAETGSSPTGGEIPENGVGTAKGGEALKGPQGKNAPQPKILNQSTNSVKSGLTDEQKREVERHNQDFENKHDRAESAPHDKVDKKFWSGVGGRTGGENDWNA